MKKADPRELPIVSVDTPLSEIRDIFSYFHEPQNVVRAMRGAFGAKAE